MNVRWPFVSVHTVQCSWGNVWRLDDVRWLTDLSWRDVVVSQLSGSTQRRRLCFNGEAVAVQTWRLTSVDDQRFASVMLPIPLFLRRCPAVQLPTLLWSLFDHSRILTDSVVELNRQFITLWWSLTFTSSKHISFSSFVLSGRLGWRHGLIWPLIGWPYQCLWDVVLSWWNQWLLVYLYNDDVILFIHYDYIQLLVNVTIAKQVI